jgi:AraC-like DNA-binding protein
MIKVQRTVDLIEKTYSDRITLQTVSTALRERPLHLGRMFQALLGVSVHEYVTHVRLGHAAHLIRSGMKIEAVALSVGYRSKKDFYRQFIRRFSVTPETYRRRVTVASRRAPARRAHQNGSKSVTAYAATFDHTACRINVEPRANVKGSPSYVATPFVVLDHGIQPFSSVGSCIEIVGETEADAIEGAARFLEHRFGTRAVAPKRQQDDTRHLPVRPPRR